MKKLLGILVLGLLWSGNAYALETPLKKLTKYFRNSELIKIPSYNGSFRRSDAYRNIRDGLYKKRPIEVDALMAFPKKGEGPFPVVMFVHASGGADLFYDEWFKFNRMAAKSLLKKGIAVMFLDNFSARGQKNTYKNQTSIQHWSTFIDAFKALEYLSKDPKVDIKKVGITGFSRGGAISLMASEKRLRDALVSKDLYFAAAQPRSPPCRDIGMFVNPQPIKETKTWLVLGGADNYTLPGPCVELGEKYKANGADIEITVKKGWHHGFTANYKPERDPKAQIWSKCPPAYTNDEGYLVTNSDAQYPYPCVTYGATMGGDKGAVFKKPFLKFFEKNLLN
jgi:dienelactone hydrolase